MNKTTQAHRHKSTSYQLTLLFSCSECTEIHYLFIFSHAFINGQKSKQLVTESAV